MRGIVYFLIALAVALVSSRLPLFGAATRTVPWYLWDLALPAAGSAVLSGIRVEGRTFHLFAAGVARYALTPRELGGMRRCASRGALWQPDDIVFLLERSGRRAHTRSSGSDGARAER